MERAQDVIINGLRASFSGLTVVGVPFDRDLAVDEPDLTAGAWKARSDETQDAAAENVPVDMPPPGETDVDAFPADFAEVCVFVDPVDGAQDLSKGGGVCCQTTLIGIAWRGRPVAGIMALPFYEGKRDGRCVYGVVGGKLHGLDEEICHALAVDSPRANTETGLVLAAPHAVQDLALQKAICCIDAAASIVTAGCGAKVLRLLVGQADVAVFPISSSLGASCACAALLETLSADAKLTALAGHPIEHTAGPEASSWNNLGVLATGPQFALRAGRSHEGLALVIRALPEVARLYGLDVQDDEGPQALDMVRDVQGNLLTPRDFASLLGRQVDSFRVNESDAVRFVQSAACRVRCLPSGSVFYKRVSLRELPSAIRKSMHAPQKVLRDVRSCGVEVAFLRAAETRIFAAVADGRPRLALPYRIDAAPRFDVPLDSRCGLFLPDLCQDEGWTQFPHLDTERLGATLEALARFHAFFWIDATPEGAPGRTLAPALWPKGAYWHLGQQNKGRVDLIEAKWPRIHETLGLAQDLRGLGAAVRSLAAEASMRTHGVCENGQHMDAALWRPQTVVHGDCKSANVLFNQATGEVALIDFQWSGAGRAATDVAYCIASSCSPESLREHEALLARYFAALLAAFDEFGNRPAAMPSREEVDLDFQWAWVDLARAVLADHWKKISLESIAIREGGQSFRAYDKSLPVARGFVEATDAIVARLLRASGTPTNSVWCPKEVGSSSGLPQMSSLSPMHRIMEPLSN